MSPQTRQRLATAVGFLIAAILISDAFFYAPSLGVFTGGFLGTFGFIAWDRMNRQLWEQSISYQMKKIEEAQKSLTSEVTRATEEIVLLKDHVSETARNIRPVYEPPQKSARPGARAVPQREEEDVMPLALRPGAEAPKRSYEDIVSGQHDLTELAVKQVVNDAIRSQRVELFLQPIVRLPQRKIRFYEMFARVRAKAGLYLPAARYMKVAMDGRMMQSIDQLLITEVLDIIRETAKIDRAAPFFINVTPGSLKNAAFMQKLLAFLGTYRPLASRLIFELSQDDFKTLQPAILQIIVALGKLGCLFSIDNVKDLNFDLGKMLQAKVRYVKIPAKDLLPGKSSFADIQRMKRRLEGNGIAVIAEKIETERALKELFDLDINYGQGHLFGKPDLQGAYQEKGIKGRRFV